MPIRERFSQPGFPLHRGNSRKDWQDPHDSMGGVFADNEKALRFYTRVGFNPVGEFENSDHARCLDMMLAIPAP